MAFTALIQIRKESKCGKKASTSIEKMVIPSESETDFKEEKGQVKCDYCNDTNRLTVNLNILMAPIICP